MFVVCTTFVCIHRIGRVFTKEAVAQLQSEAGAGSESTGTASTASQLKVSQDEVDVSSQTKSGAGCGGLLWQMAWCPLLQVSHNVYSFGWLHVFCREGVHAQ